MSISQLLVPSLVFAAPPGGYGPPAGGYGGGGGYGPPLPGNKETPPMAIVSLVAGIMSWFMCPLIGGLVAVFTGMSAKKTIRGDPSRYTGEGLATAGTIIGGINLAIMVIGVLGYLASCVICGGCSVVSSLAGV